MRTYTADEFAAIIDALPDVAKHNVTMPDGRVIKARCASMVGLRAYAKAARAYLAAEVAR